MQNELSIKLEQLRKEKKLTLREVAEKTGLSHAYIRDIELNYNRATKGPISPTPDTLRKLSIAYDYSYQELMKLAGFISEGDDQTQELIDGSNVSQKRKELINLILNDLTDDEVQAWYNILNKHK
ncbi:MAG TPA: helix-turn-helix transcriptional regulator [Candidatus Bathyarchaeia archaeon]|nr:helix-turn-helix transcriptional regulator [Candidatus Bathyarchaeia archaeon]